LIEEQERQYSGFEQKGEQGKRKAGKNISFFVWKRR
jgi:hypothetical protein